MSPPGVIEALHVDRAEEILERHVAGEPIAFHVEEDVAGRRCRERAQAVPDLPGVEQLMTRHPAGIWSAMLQCGLRSQRVECRRTHARRGFDARRRFARSVRVAMPAAWSTRTCPDRMRATWDR